MRWLVFNLVLYAATRCLAQPPPNDHFTNRIALNGSLAVFGGDTSEATWPEADIEPCAGDDGCDRTLWWSWTAQDSTAVIIERLGDFSSEYAALAVYTATNFSDMPATRICGIDLLPHGQCCVFQPLPGKQYQIQIGGYPSKSILYQLIVTNVPVIRLHPRTQTISEGQSVLLTSFAIGMKPVRYQWRKDGVDLVSATNCMLALDSCTVSNSANYCVVVTSATGVSTSKVARLNVLTNEVAPYFTGARMVNVTNFQFDVIGEEGRLYEIQYSSDLKNWGFQYPNQWHYEVVQNTNLKTSFSRSVSIPAQFIRFRTYHAPSEVCVNNLRKLWFAIQVSAEDNHKRDYDAAWTDLLAYLPGGSWPICPSATGNATNVGTYTITTYIDRPTCWIVPDSHILFDP